MRHAGRTWRESSKSRCRKKYPPCGVLHILYIKYLLDRSRKIGQNRSSNPVGELKTRVGGANRSTFFGRSVRVRFGVPYGPVQSRHTNTARMGWKPMPRMLRCQMDLLCRLTAGWAGGGAVGAG